MSAPESTAKAFERYQQSKASALRYIQARSNLEAMHSLESPLEVLDAASGNGLSSAWLLEKGHRLTLLDADSEMLETAAERIQESGASERAIFVHGQIEQADQVLAGRRYDLILCHHVLEYLAEPVEAMRALRSVAAEGGALSLITLNPVSEVLRGVIQHQDPARAIHKLDDLSYDAMWFGEASLIPGEEVAAMAERAGWRRSQVRAIRVICDYLAEDIKNERFDELVALEARLLDRDPYRWIGRYLQQSFVTD